MFILMEIINILYWLLRKVDHSKLMTCSSKTIVSFFRFGMTDCPLVFVFGFMNKQLSLSRIMNARVIFWDFDGVIKDSVPVKTEAFRKIFLPFGIDVANKVVEHHLENGGVSRYKKILYYFKTFIGKNISKERIKSLCK